MLNILSIVALITALFGNVLINFRKKSGYIVWIVSNILWIIVNLIGPCNIPQIIMYVVYVMLNIQGMVSWCRMDNNRVKEMSDHEAE